MENRETVLVTGGSGFIASYCMITLLNNGYKVRATLRSLRKSELVKEMLKEGEITSFENLSFAEADLEDEASWEKAVQGCQYVIHVASPTPNTSARTEDDFVIPAKNGVLFVMRAAKKAGVKRVVLTSAFGAVGMGTTKTTPYTEEDWTVINDKVAPYQRSKTISEQAAWDFIENEGAGMELSVVNPTGVLGPVLADDYSHSIQTIKQMLNGEVSGCPKMSFGYVDVRDVADLHFKAMTMPQANGQRFIAVAGKSISILDTAKILRENLGEKASKVPTKELPNWLVRLLAVFIPKLKMIVPHLGLVKEASNEKAKTLLGWNPRSNEEAVIATAKSLIHLNLVK
ncbi:dihydroflavonol-4-reductase [Dyadobacter sp. SG02]|uniref:SDR family oxidoreductase n=1 Tax=Dyadobacter sp. SG02 TaxID=1855291 RepID=UPI0008B0029B|nr:aldehyde reductase [Dyadobacter sp. SG02]SEI50799.1 dihydroflavonol-4-reductase [Dyadobacter sp. SG02]